MLKHYQRNNRPGLSAVAECFWFWVGSLQHQSQEALVGDKSWKWTESSVVIKTHRKEDMGTLLDRKVIRELSKFIFHLSALDISLNRETFSQEALDPCPRPRWSPHRQRPTCSIQTYIIFVIFGALPHFLGLYKGHQKVHKLVTKWPKQAKILRFLC